MIIEFKLLELVILKLVFFS